MKKKYIVSTITFICFLIITVLLLTNNIKTFDSFIYNFFYKLRSNNIIKNFFINITHLGDTKSSIIITLIILLILKNKNRILLIACSATTLGINQLLKHIFLRPRPPIAERLVKQGGYSYPSGHTMMATCLYGVLIYIILKEIKNKKLKIALVSICIFMIATIGLSRIYVRVHWPSDVFAGYFLTITILIVTISIVNHFLGGKKNEKNVCK